MFVSVLEVLEFCETKKSFGVYFDERHTHKHTVKFVDKRLGEMNERRFKMEREYGRCCCIVFVRIFSWSTEPCFIPYGVGHLLRYCTASYDGPHVGWWCTRIVLLYCTVLFVLRRHGLG